MSRTSYGRLLVFVHADDERFDQSGVQAPAVRDGELPEQAVLREAAEETGLQGLRIERHLGTGEYDVQPYADAIDAPEVPQRWRAGERGDGDSPPIRFELYWLPLAQAHMLAAGQGSFLGRLFD